MTGLPKSTKALFITPVAPWGSFGGTATVSRNLIALFSESVALQVCCLRSDRHGIYPAVMEGATVLSGPVPAFHRQMKFFFDFSRESFAHRQFQKNLVRRRLRDLLARTQPDLIILDHIFSAWVADLLPRAKVIFIAHDDMVAYAASLLELKPPFLKRLRFLRLRKQYRSLQLQMLQRADFVLTMMAEDADRLAPDTNAPVKVAPLFFAMKERTAPLPNKFSYLLVTGSFDTWEKQLGLTQFLQTVHLPSAQREPDLSLVVAGRIPVPFQRALRRVSASLRIVHGPSASEMQHLVENASAAAVLDLQASGLKIKTIELAAAGLPVLGWAAGLDGTGLVHGESCLQAKSYEDFISHLSRLYEDAELRRQLGQSGRAAVASRYSINSARRQLQALKLFGS